MTLYFCKSIISSVSVLRAFNVPLPSQFVLKNAVHSIVNPQTSSKILSAATANGTQGNYWALTSIRTNVRDYWPRPSERKRLKMNFWNRLKTRNGRAILMRRYLKGRHVLSH